MFQPIRVAVCGRKVAPPLFETLEVLGRETCLQRIDQAILKLKQEGTNKITMPNDDSAGNKPVNGNEGA
ncbi:MAG: hypothetical protein QM757_21680 [Paludibaculum sp.]